MPKQNRPLVHSFSSLKQFSTCPRQFYHARIKRDLPFKPSRALEEGNAIHKELELRLTTGETLTYRPAALEPICALLDKARQRGGYKLGVERSMTVNEAFAPTRWWADDAWLRSKLDVVLVKKDRALILDWKTGQRRVDETQLKLFAAQVFAHMPAVMRVTTAYVWTVSAKLDAKTYPRSAFGDLKREVQDAAGRVEHALEIDSWQANPCWACKFCGCTLSMCEYA